MFIFQEKEMIILLPRVMFSKILYGARTKIKRLWMKITVLYILQLIEKKKHLT